MSTSICPSCGASVATDERCARCSALTAIALPEAAAKAKITPPAARETAISDGMPPLPTPHPRRDPSQFRLAIYGVVAVIIVTLLGVLIPTVQQLRVAAARTDSTNHLKQIALGAQSFHDANKRLPFNGSAVAVGGAPYSLEAKPGDPRSGSWGFQIAPYIGQQAMFAAGTSNIGIDALMCPRRNRYLTSSTPAAGAATPPWSDYVLNPWLNDSTEGSHDAADVERTLVSITDGTSNTIFFGHGQIRPADYGTTQSTPGYLDTILIGGTTATALSSNPALGAISFARDSADTRTDAARGFGSPFEQGCLMGMCDGTVRMFPYSMELGSFGSEGIAAPLSSVATFLTPTGGEFPLVPCQ